MALTAYVLLVRLDVADFTTIRALAWCRTTFTRAAGGAATFARLALVDAFSFLATFAAFDVACKTRIFGSKFDDLGLIVFPVACGFDFVNLHVEEAFLLLALEVEFDDFLVCDDLGNFLKLVVLVADRSCDFEFLAACLRSTIAREL